MTTKYYHGVMNDVDDDGNVRVLYPKTFIGDIIMDDGQSLSDHLTAEDNTEFNFSKNNGKYGYKDANGAFVPFKTVQASKTVAAGTSAITVTPDTGNDGIASVTVNPTPSQTKSATPSTSAQTITPDAGKLLSSVSVDAISPVIGWEGATITDGGIDNDKPYVWVPYGYHINSNNGRNPIFINENTLQNIHRHTKQGYLNSNGNHDIGVYHGYRYINVNVPNSNNSTTTTNSIGTKDLGETNNIRYVNIRPYIYLGMFSLICYAPTVSSKMIKALISCTKGYFDNLEYVQTYITGDYTDNTVTVPLNGTSLQFKFTLNTTFPFPAFLVKNLTSVEVYNSTGNPVTAFYCLDGESVARNSATIPSDNTWHALISNVEIPIAASHDFGPSTASEAESCIGKGHIVFGAARQY